MLQIYAQRRELVRTLLPIYAIWRGLDASLRFLAFGEIAPAPTWAAPALGWLTFTLFATACFFAPLLAVLWHRLILRPKNYWPEFKHVGHYLITFLLQMLLAMLILLPFIALIWLTDQIHMPGFRSIAAQLVSFGSSIMAVWFAYRIGLTLPAVAIGNKRVGFVDAWDATSGLGWSLGWLAVVTAVVNVLVITLCRLAASVSDVMGLLAEYALSPISALFGLGLLTILYIERIAAA